MATTSPASRPPPASSAPSPARPHDHLKRAGSSKSSTNSNSGPLYMQAADKAALVRRIKRKNETPMKQFKRWFVDNQTGVAFNLFALLFLAHGLFPRLRVHTTKFFTLSYYNPATGQYNLGADDFCFVVFLITLFTGLRAGTMEYLLAPYARSRGLCRRKSVARFSEQAWLVIVYTVFWPLGAYLYYQSPYFLNMKNIWTHWPGREMGGLLKAYILVQLAFWVQQIIVINIEERRKDHWQMLTHHFVTVSLIFASYRYRHTPVANVILICMDISDFFLPLAKCQKYLGYTTLCDYTFGAFMLTWFVPRHIFFTMIIYSVWRQTPQIMPVGCFRGGLGATIPLGIPVGPDEVSSLTPALASLLKPVGASPETANKLAYLLEPLVDSEGAVCYNPAVKWAFLSMLLFLQLIILVWFGMIVQVAIRVVRGSGAEDSRSDDEEEEEEEEYEEEEVDVTETYKAALAAGVDAEDLLQPLEEEVGVEALDLRGWERRTHGSARRAHHASSATGVSLPGHSDRKELLGRIGCEKQVD